MQIKKISLLMSFLLIFFSMTASVFAQEVSPTVTPTPKPIGYDLPYPGILPGHPFYFLKVFRDNIKGFFISNPLKKAEFDLLQADKQVSAAQYLISQKKDMTIVVATLVSAENYFTDALRKANDAKKQGMDAKDLMERLHVANLKHQEVIVDMIKSVNGKDKEILMSELKFFKEFAKSTK